MKSVLFLYPNIGIVESAQENRYLVVTMGLLGGQAKAMVVTSSCKEGGTLFRPFRADFFPH
jgi:hypothetical protein